MASLKWSVQLRGGLAGLLAVAASTASFGAEAEGIVRIRSNDKQPSGIVIRGQSPSDCIPFAPVISAAKTQSGAPVAALTATPAKQPSVTKTSGEAAAGETTAPALLTPATELTGEFAGLFSSESAAPFNKPLEFAAADPAPAATSVGSGGSEGVAQVGHRARKRERQMKECQNESFSGGYCPTYTAAPMTNACPPMYYEGCPDMCGRRCVLGNNPLADKLRCCSINHRMRNRQCSDALSQICHDECDEKFNWFRCKFGYFFPSGTCGKGSAICGKYSMVYPVNPEYSDPRDCGVYAAQGYYGPVAVPLAPVVHHTYNYGWGVPSSRLTPVGNYVAPY